MSKSKESLNRNNKNNEDVKGKKAQHPILILVVILVVGWILFHNVTNRYIIITIQNEKIREVSIQNIDKTFLATLLENTQQSRTPISLNISFYNLQISGCYSLNGIPQLNNNCKVFETTIPNLKEGVNIQKLDFLYTNLPYKVDLYISGNLRDSKISTLT